MDTKTSRQNKRLAWCHAIRIKVLPARSHFCICTEAIAHTHTRTHLKRALILSHERSPPNTLSVSIFYIMIGADKSSAHVLFSCRVTITSGWWKTLWTVINRSLLRAHTVCQINLRGEGKVELSCDEPGESSSPPHTPREETCRLQEKTLAIEGCSSNHIWSFPTHRVRRTCPGGGR